ncbi:MAG TPA: adenosyl-hopene transferase HpnH [Thermodesulfovibrionia bacterium]|nr:adenosyl-hopene transferase HpnH [Thermodesulfovibrionia bacterium]
MSIPLSQAYAVVKYITQQKLRRNRYYPLVLMLEPLFRCNLACAGCGKISYPDEILQQRLTTEQCFAAVDECGAPIVSIPGGEPLLHEAIDRIVAGLIAREKYIYLCTNGQILKQKLHLFKPSRYLTFSVHLDGLDEYHDRIVGRQGAYDTATQAIRHALKMGFRVTTNTTLYADADVQKTRLFFDTVTSLGVESMMISPGYSFSSSSDQDNFLSRQRSVELFSHILANSKREWKFNQSPLFLDFLMGQRQYECTPWCMPTYNIFGWQKPCYLVDEGYASSFRQLLEETDWTRYGRASGNIKCRDCMVHSGYEGSAVIDTFGSWNALIRSGQILLFGLHGNLQTTKKSEIRYEGKAG